MAIAWCYPSPVGVNLGADGIQERAWATSSCSSFVTLLSARYIPMPSTRPKRRSLRRPMEISGRSMICSTSNQNNLEDETLSRLADDLGLSAHKLRESLVEMYRARIDADFLGGVRSGVNARQPFSSTVSATTAPTILTIDWRQLNRYSHRRVTLIPCTGHR
jgi:hypothetical protein